MSHLGFDRLVDSGFFPHKGGGGGGTSTQSVISVPDWAQPAVAAFASRAYDMWQAPTLTVYPGTIVAAMPANESSGISGLAARGQAGDPVVAAGSAFVDKTINGDFLEGGTTPFGTMVAKKASQSLASFNTMKALIGKSPFYNGGAAPAFSLLAQDLMTSQNVYPKYLDRDTKAMYADNRKRERAHQDQAMSYGVEMGKHPAIDAETLRKAGVYIREYLQSTYELDHKLFTEQQNLAVANLEIMGNVIRGLTGSQQTTTAQHQGGSKVMAAVGYGIGGAMAGAYLGAQLGAGGGPIGMAIGAGVGIIAGLIWG